MSSDNVWERLFKLWATICKLLVDGKRDLNKVAEILQGIIDEKATNPYLRKIASGKLVATQGRRTLAKAKETFPGYLDPDFKGYGTDVEGETKEATPFEVFELIKDGQFKQIFNGFGVELDRLCWSQDQIIKFVEDHSDLLHPNGWATFFLFKVGKEFFVANVNRHDDGQLKAYVYRLSHDNVWNAGCRHRFVLPQQTA